eukprot:1177718-Prorocentrum_minimum.AAC.2
MQHYGVTPVVVFDGDSLPAKAHTADKRRESRRANIEKAKQEEAAGNLDKARVFMQRGISVTADMTLDLIRVLRAEGVEYYVSPYEADSQVRRHLVSQYDHLVSPYDHLVSLLTVSPLRVPYPALRIPYRCLYCHPSPFIVTSQGVTRGVYGLQGACGLCLYVGLHSRAVFTTWTGW